MPFLLMELVFTVNKMYRYEMETYHACFGCMYTGSLS